MSNAADRCRDRLLPVVGALVVVAGLAAGWIAVQSWLMNR